MPKIGVVGYFGFSTDNPIIGGQMAKTLGIYDQLCKNHGEENVQIVDTSNWKAEKVKLVSQCWRVACSCKKIIIMPNKHGIKFVLPFFCHIEKCFPLPVSISCCRGMAYQSARESQISEKEYQKN